MKRTTAIRPPGLEGPKAPRPSGDFRDASWLPKAIVLVIALGAIVAGAGFLVGALEGADYMMESGVPRWIGIGAGLLFLLPGMAALGLFLYGIGVPLGRAAALLGGGAVLVALGSLLAIFHWGAFFGESKSWSGTQIGPVGPREVARIGIVWMDLLALQGIALLSWLAMRRPRNLIETTRTRWAALAFLLAPAVVAGALHVSGTFDLIEATFGPGVRSAGGAQEAAVAPPKAAPPARPLAYYLGTWLNPRMGQHESHTVEVRSDGGSVYIRAWQTCRPKDCVLGEGQARVIRAEDGTQVIELRGEFRHDGGGVSTIVIMPESAAQLRSREAWRIGGRVYGGGGVLRRRE